MGARPPGRDECQVGTAGLRGAALLLRFVVPQRQPDPAGVTTADASPPEPVPPDPRAFAPRASVARILRALMHHRFSVAMIIPLIVLTMLSGSAILEQLPDVQRRWASDGAQGWLQALAAVLVLIGVAMLLEVLARSVRAGRNVTRSTTPTVTRAPLAAVAARQTGRKKPGCRPCCAASAVTCDSSAP